MTIENPAESTPAPQKRAPRTRKKPVPVTEVPVTDSSEEKITPQETVASPVVTAEPEEVKIDTPEAKPAEKDDLDELRSFFDEVDEEPEPEPVIPPLSVRGNIIAPGYWQGFAGPFGRINVFSWLGLIFAFAFFPLGLIFSSLGLVNAKAVPGDTLGRVAGWIGFSISGLYLVFTLLWLLFLPLSLFLGALTPPVGW